MYIQFIFNEKNNCFPLWKISKIIWDTSSRQWATGGSVPFKQSFKEPLTLHCTLSKGDPETETVKKEMIVKALDFRTKSSANKNAIRN